MAAEAGQLKVVQWILDRDQQDNRLKNAVDRYPHRSLFVTCLGGEASLAIHSAAVNGQLEIAKLLHANATTPRNQGEKDTEKISLRQLVDKIPNDRDVIREVSGKR